ncbi:unnamed protein product [Prorocentrum cordatum]|uniref:Fibronectin type-III domain-containing protein n=1 Tax=Prorocentrum cordatum TaxID=2364126 RepID=A0ABN9SCM8_9DINO|nr:unnamed protein product [Polarella glacialis]
MPLQHPVHRGAPRRLPASQAAAEGVARPPGSPASRRGRLGRARLVRGVAAAARRAMAEAPLLLRVAARWREPCAGPVDGRGGRAHGAAPVGGRRRRPQGWLRRGRAAAPRGGAAAPPLPARRWPRHRHGVRGDLLRAAGAARGLPGGVGRRPRGPDRGLRRRPPGPRLRDEVPVRRRGRGRGRGAAGAERPRPLPCRGALAAAPPGGGPRRAPAAPGRRAALRARGRRQPLVGVVGVVRAAGAGRAAAGARGRVGAARVRAARQPGRGGAHVGAVRHRGGAARRRLPRGGGADGLPGREHAAGRAGSAGRPRDAWRVRHHSAENLAPGVEYIFTVSASYPGLGGCCAQQGPADSSLFAVLATAGVDGPAFEPPGPPKHLAPPDSHGGVGRRAPWGWDFWLAVDRRALARCSRPSPPMVAAFATTPKPRLALRQSPAGRLELAVGFALCGLPPSAAAARAVRADPEVWPAAGAHPKPPADTPRVPEACGHRFATRVQVRRRLAGDQHEGGGLELAPMDLDRAALAPVGAGEEGLPEGWLVGAVRLPVHRPEFADGEKHVVSLRIGDGWRWSAWSAWSKPAHVRVPPVAAPEGGVQVTAQPPARATVRFTAPRSELGVPVECALWACLLGPDGAEARDGRQLVAVHTEGGLPAGGAAQWRQLEVGVGQLLPRRSYRFALMARPLCNVLGPPAFQEVASSAPLVWQEEAAAGDDEGAHVDVESWDIPQAVPVPVPESIEAGRGVWRGRAVLLAWPRGTPVGDDPPLELQGHAEGESGPAAWAPVPWSLQYLQERPHVVAAPLPFAQGRFRWWSRDRRVGGPRSELCVAAVEPPSEPEVHVFCSETAVYVHIRAPLPHPSHRSAPLCQARFQRVDCVQDAAGEARDVPVGEWQTPQAAELRAEGAHPHRALDTVYGEADGLELGRRYVFSVRCGDRRRRSPWSASSPPVLFDVPEAMAPRCAEAGGALLVEALAPTSVRLWWAEVRAPEALSPRSVVALGAPPRSTGWTSRGSSRPGAWRAARHRPPRGRGGRCCAHRRRLPRPAPRRQVLRGAGRAVCEDRPAGESGARLG